MKLLLDNNLSYKMCKSLEKDFSSVEHVKTLLSVEAEDIAVWTYAKENDYTILTKDNDFNELSLLRGCPPKVIQLLCGNEATETILRLVVLNKEVILKFDDSHDCLLKIFK